MVPIQNLKAFDFGTAPWKTWPNSPWHIVVLIRIFGLERQMIGTCLLFSFFGDLLSPYLYLSKAVVVRFICFVGEHLIVLIPKIWRNGPRWVDRIGPTCLLFLLVDLNLLFSFSTLTIYHVNLRQYLIPVVRLYLSWISLFPHLNYRYLLWALWLCNACFYF